MVLKKLKAELQGSLVGCRPWGRTESDATEATEQQQQQQNYHRIQPFHSGAYSQKKKKETLIQKDTCTPMFIDVLFTIAEVWKHLECPVTDERIRSVCVCVCVCIPLYIVEYCLGIKKNETLPGATTWMDVERIMLQ